MEFLKLLGFGARWRKPTFWHAAAAAVGFLKCMDIGCASKVTVWSNLWTLANKVTSVEASFDFWTSSRQIWESYKVSVWGNGNIYPTMLGSDWSIFLSGFI